ncbi:hypothetical protein [Spiroplasma culicicola]|uniref:Uncharacterized protein n=1 Tax=Spiroplasma culicicola AES-1 TaxID=1276246 RepID=W6A7Y6_9MOLU|nr:hypothetical protein [Spiroplasma culicicola]AHI53000.1 hypothetical protein SCULI_v1c06590 [Spiroplasma culicicola AES-1]
MQKLLSMIGIVSLNITSVSPILQSKLQENINNSYIKNTECILNQNITADECKNEVISNYIEGTDIFGNYAKIYIDEWIVNLNYDLWYNSSNTEYNYETIYRLLQTTVPNFHLGTHEEDKKTIVQTFMDKSREYANLKSSGIIIEIKRILSQKQVSVGIMDTWKRYPNDQVNPTNPWGDQVTWTGNQKINGYRSSIALPEWFRFASSINELVDKFQYFSFTNAEVKSFASNDSKTNYDLRNYFSTTNILTQNTLVTQDYHYSKFPDGTVDLTTRYDVLVDGTNIKIRVNYQGSSVFSNSKKFGFNANYGDYFVLVNNFNQFELEQSYNKFLADLNTRQPEPGLPPAGGSQAVSNLLLQFDENNLFLFEINLNHALLEILRITTCMHPNWEHRQLLTSTLFMISTQFAGSSSQERNFIIDRLMDAFNEYYDNGLIGLLQQYWPDVSRYGVAITIDNHDGYVTNSILPWNQNG